MASLTDPSQVFPPEASAEGAADAALPAVTTLEINEECLVAEICIDRYLWALYERAPKIDAIKVAEQRKVKVKRKRKTVTVTRTFTRRVDEEFGWKDPKAAEKAGMTMMDYVIGGMDRSFKLKLFYTLYAAEQAGLQPGITSAFRDNYRQSIASGLKAATDRSYHGGSLRGGYGRGLAADIVSVNGTDPRATMGLHRKALEVDRRERQGLWDRTPLSRQGSTPRRADRRPGICLPPRRRENASGGSEQQEGRGSRRGRKSRKRRPAKVAEVKSKKGSRHAVRDDRGKAKQARTAKIAKNVKMAKVKMARNVIAKPARTAKLARARTM